MPNKTRGLKKPSRQNSSGKTVEEDRAPAYRTAADQSRPLRFIDLFCGIGGFRIAFERAGAQCVFSSDYDKFSQQTYEANFGDLPHGDIHGVAVVSRLLARLNIEPRFR